MTSTAGLKAVVLPPRPNPGPEPWPEPRPPYGLWATALLFVLAAAVAVRVARYRRRPPAAAASVPRVEPDGPRPAVVRAAESVRTALVARFGPAWAAKTTEEIGADPVLPALVGSATSDRIIGLFAAADLTKFAGDDAEGPADPAAEADALARAVLEAGATSRINGK